MRVPPISRHLSNYTNILQSSSESMITKKKRKEWLDSSGNKVPRRRLDHSRSSKVSGANPSKGTLPDMKSSQLQLNQPVDSNSSRFLAPIRSSKNGAQTSILSNFSQDKCFPMHLTHSPLSTLTGQQQLSSIKHGSTSSLIHLSPLGQQQLSSIKHGSTSSLPLCTEQLKTKVNDEFNLTDDNSSVEDAHKGKTVSATLDNIGTNNSMEELANVTTSSSGSFTVHKRHTFSSAAAAGLPVVDGNFSCSNEKKAIFQEPTDEHSKANGHKNTILLTNFLHLHHNTRIDVLKPEKELTVPPSVQRLKEKLVPILAGFNSAEAKLEAQVTALVDRVCPRQSREIKRIQSEISKPKSPAGNIVSSVVTNNGIEGIPTINDSSSTHSEVTKPDGTDLAGLEYHDSMTSLEQFERDEQLALQQATPNNSEQLEIKSAALVSVTQFCSDITNKSSQQTQQLQSYHDGGADATFQDSTCNVYSKGEVDNFNSTSNVGGTSKIARVHAEEEERIEENKILPSHNASDITSGNDRLGIDGDKIANGVRRHGAGGDGRYDGRHGAGGDEQHEAGDVGRYGAGMGFSQDNPGSVVNGNSWYTTYQDTTYQEPRTAPKTDDRSVDSGSIEDATAGECRYSISSLESVSG